MFKENITIARKKNLNKNVYFITRFLFLGKNFKKICEFISIEIKGLLFEIVFRRNSNIEVYDFFFQNS